MNKTLRRLLKAKKMGISIVMVAILGAMLLVSCSPAAGNLEPEANDEPGANDPIESYDVDQYFPGSIFLPTEDGIWTLPDEPSDTQPTGMGMIDIRDGVGTFTFDSAEIETVRPDIFQPGYFSLFDALLQLDGVRTTSSVWICILIRMVLPYNFIMLEKST